MSYYIMCGATVESFSLRCAGACVSTCTNRYIYILASACDFARIDSSMTDQFTLLSKVAGSMGAQVLSLVLMSRLWWNVLYVSFRYKWNHINFIVVHWLVLRGACTNKVETNRHEKNKSKIYQKPLLSDRLSKGFITLLFVQVRYFTIL